MDSYVSSLLTHLKRGTLLRLITGEKVLFVKKHGTMITVLGDAGLKNVSYHHICTDNLAMMYSSEYCYAV